MTTRSRRQQRDHEQSNVRARRSSETRTASPSDPHSTGRDSTPAGRAQQITADRQPIYGHPALNFQRCADVWNGLLGNKLLIPITAEEVAILMNGVKLVRLIETPTHIDSIDDVDGYSQCLRQINEVRDGGTQKLQDVGIRPASLVGQRLL